MRAHVSQLSAFTAAGLSYNGPAMKSSLPRKALLLVAALFALAGCGATVGDPCTTEQDCGGQVCLNKGWTPGGYCTRTCTIGVDTSCPGGSICVTDAVAKDQSGCLRTCKGNSDCRTGYVCKSVRSSSSAVCVGPDGI